MMAKSLKMLKKEAEEAKEKEDYSLFLTLSNTIKDTFPKNYYGYLSDIPKKVTDITFTPKAEEQCLSVACASIISRYIFLREMYKMSEELGKDIPKGAGINVDEFVQELVNEKGKDILTNYVKLNFKNTQKIK